MKNYTFVHHIDSSGNPCDRYNKILQDKSVLPKDYSGRYINSKYKVVNGSLIPYSEG